MSVLAAQARPALQSMQYPYDFRLNSLQGLDSLPYDSLKRPSFRQHVQRQLPAPQQPTPLPVRPTHSDGSQWNQRHHETRLPLSEDMLRRKTPSGTLNGAYNGTIGQGEDFRAHASKHMLVSSSSQLPEQEKQLLPPRKTLHSRAQRLARSRLPVNAGVSRNVSGWHGGTPPVDSMVGLNSANYDVMDWQWTTPHVMQPPLQSALGPTASHEHSPYGPYWPNGEFAPYRPAAFVDYQRASANCGWSPNHGGQVHGFSNTQDTNTSHYNDPPPIQQHNTNVDFSSGPLNIRKTSNIPRNDSLPPDQKLSFAARSRLLALQNSAQQNSVSTNVWNSSLGDQNSIAATPIPNAYESSTPQAQLSPGDVLTWAYGIYKDLVCSIQEFRRAAEKSAGSKSIPPTFGRSQQVRNQHGQIPPFQPSPTDFRFNGSSLGATPFTQGSWADASNIKPVSNTGSAWATPRDHKLEAYQALTVLNNLCVQGNRDWIDGMLLNGCLSYVLGEHENAIKWYQRILQLDSTHVEATSNLAASCLSLNRRPEAEEYWRRAVRLRPTYFEAVEHLIGLLCFDKRHKDAIQIIDQVQAVLQSRAKYEAQCNAIYAQQLSCRYANLGRDNGRMMALIHAKGNLMYNMQDQLGAAKAFEEVVLIAVGCPTGGIETVIKYVLAALSGLNPAATPQNDNRDFLLLTPDKALQTAKLCFPNQGDLPGLEFIESIASKKAAMSVTSNSLLSLAKIFQDGMNPNSASGFKSNYGIQEILALYYLSLSLQPSPSTANNVGILLAGIQPATPSKAQKSNVDWHGVPGVVPGSGVALALTYYKYGLTLDQKHAHLYTNLGSLLKDIGQLPTAVNMYEKAVSCDSNFDIALANLANAVKDQGRVADAIIYYRRAVQVNPKFAEAVCGLANALNSICDWPGRGGVKLCQGRFDRWHVNEQGKLWDSAPSYRPGNGWIYRVVEIVESQLEEGQSWGRGVLRDDYVDVVSEQIGALAVRRPRFSSSSRSNALPNALSIRRLLESWRGQSWEGANILWLVERAVRMIGWQWYHDRYTTNTERHESAYYRPQLPEALSVLGAPTVLPFHTFTLPMTARQVRQISQRNGLRVSCSTLRSSWLPRTVFAPPAPPRPTLKIGYVSSDFNNHPLAHLMQSVFGMHDVTRFEAYCYATSTSDNSAHRAKIEREAPHFVDASAWSVERLVQQIVQDGIHILINLNGYTRGARNEIFAARPAPIQMSFMGFAGSLGAEWCDYLLADETAVPKQTLRPYRHNIDITDLAASDNAGVAHTSANEEWVYPENIVYARHAFFCCDHAQSATPDPYLERSITWDKELMRRWQMRRELFPDLPPNTIILANFNQLYKIDPTTFRTWLRILSRVPNAILWLLRFPADGAQNLLKTAQLWAEPHVASRIRFTDVAPKGQHIARACVADLFLDTNECNAHTTAADCLWSGTPLLTLPRYEWKMCSRMAAGIVGGALDLDTAAGQAARDDLVAVNEDDYEKKAIALANGLRYTGGEMGTPIAQGRLVELREMLWKARWTSKLFDTRRWVKDLELAYTEVWRRWVEGEGGDVWIKDLVK